MHIEEEKLNAVLSCSFWGEKKNNNNKKNVVEKEKKKKSAHFLEM